MVLTSGTMVRARRAPERRRGRVEVSVMVASGEVMR